MTITLKIIFVGLIAISSGPNDPSLVLLAQSSQAEHYPMVVQIQGKCEGKCTWNPAQKNLLKGAHLVDQVLWFPPQVDVTWDVPYVNTGSEGALDDVPSVDRMVPGPAPLDVHCLFGNSCPVAARLWPPTDSLAVCHHLHMPSVGCGQDNGKRLEYSLAGDRRVVADAVMLEMEVNAEKIPMLAWKLGSSDELAKAELSPAKGGSRVTLVVSNLPAGFGARMTEGCPSPPLRLRHFVSFYKLLDGRRGRLGRSSTVVPRNPSLEEDGPLYLRRWPPLPCSASTTCEDVLRCLQGVSLFPHGGSECDMATFP